MQLQELKKLIEYDALSFLMATSYKDGWVLVAVKKGEDEKTVLPKDCALNRARGGVRIFKTIDAIKSLVDSDLSYSKFTVC